MAERWSVRVTKDYTIFAAAHFITYGGGQCERLHGHNYRVWAEVWGPLDENQYVFDFIALKDLLRAITDRLDHRLLLPRDNPLIQVEQRGEEVEARYREKRWIVPADDCIILPLANTTAELLARWIAGELRKSLERDHDFSPERLIVEVEENVGQLARYEWTPDGA